MSGTWNFVYGYYTVSYTHLEIVVRVRVHISSAWAAFLGEKNMTVRELVNKMCIRDSIRSGQK